MIEALELPVFVSENWQTGVAPEVHEAATSWRLGPPVKVPNRPNTKPAMAMAAMRVIAMRMTVGHRIYGLVTVGLGNSH